MKKTDTTESLIREINMLRLTLFQTMLMWREDRTSQKFTSATLCEVVEDWRELASSLDKRQWMAGARSMLHYTHVCRNSIWSENAQQMLDECSLCEQYFDYSVIGKFTNFKPPKLKSARLIKAGMDRIRREFHVLEKEVHPNSHGARTGAFTGLEASVISGSQFTTGDEK